jgi:hypothetical protein
MQHNTPKTNDTNTDKSFFAVNKLMDYFEELANFEEVLSELNDQQKQDSLSHLLVWFPLLYL